MSTQKRFVTWRTTKVDNAVTREDAIALAQRKVQLDGGRVFVLEVLYVVESATPPIEVKSFQGATDCTRHDNSWQI